MNSKEFDIVTKQAKEIKDLKAELEEVKRKAWKTVDLKEGNLLVFVGVHVVDWQQEWGRPRVGFTRWNTNDDD